MYGFWTDPAAFAGKTLLIVSDRRDRLRDAPARLSARCGRVDTLPSLTVRRGPHPVTTFDLYRCVGYRPDRASIGRSGPSAAIYQKP
jgi:hypothetical protein